MSEAQADMASVIHRKAKVARDEFDAREMSPSKALRLGLAKAADALFELQLVVRMVEHASVPLVEIETVAGDDGLLILLDGAAGPPGAVKLDLQFVMAMIEVQLMGEVRQGEAAARPFTPTDAAIVQPLMNEMLERFAAQINACDAIPDAELFRFGDRVENGRALALALSAADYDLYRVNVDFGPGAKTGVMELFLPERPPEPVSDPGGDAHSLAAKLEENAMNAPVMLDAVLAPLRLPLQEVCRWAPGTVLPLAPEVVSKARIVGAKGHEIAQAKLGQLNGFRAVRMVMKQHGEQADDAEVAPAAARKELQAPAVAADVSVPSFPEPGMEALPPLPSGGMEDLPPLPEVEGLPDLPELPAMEGLPDLPLGEESNSELDAAVEEELARAAARFDMDADDDGMPMTGGPSLGAPLE